MQAGDDIFIKAKVLRVDEDTNRVDTQTADGKLIQTDATNVVPADAKPERPIMVAGGAIEHDAKEAGRRAKGK